MRGLQQGDHDSASSPTGWLPQDRDGDRLCVQLRRARGSWYDAARKVILDVSPDVTEHSLKVHLAPLRPPTADPRRPVVIREHTPTTTRSANQGAA